MTSVSEFREFATEMLDFVSDYLENVRDRPVLPKVKPGYLQNLLPSHAPDKPEQWKEVMADLEKVIMPGVTHWASPHFHAYYPGANSYPSIVADIFISAVTMVGFSWYSGPVCTELEMVVLNWLAQWFKLPEHFLFSDKGKGGGVLQGSACESLLTFMLAAKASTLSQNKELSETDLVVYASRQAHSSCERSALMCGVRFHSLELNESLQVSGEVLQQAVNEDRAKGLQPFFVVGCFGTTHCCAFDLIAEMGDVCNAENLWFHVDAAYAGSALVCPEFWPMREGLEKADSIVINLHKWMLVSFDCAATWVKDKEKLTETFNVDPIYMKHPYENGNVPDYRHWQIPMSRRMRSLKVWFVMRLYGKEGIQGYIRNHVRLAKLFETLLLQDERFELFCPSRMALVCFCLRGKSNGLIEQLIARVNHEGKIHVTPGSDDGIHFIRFAICSRDCTDEDIHFAIGVFKKHASELLSTLETRPSVNTTNGLDHQFSIPNTKCL